MMPTLVTTNMLLLLAGVHAGVGSAGSHPQRHGAKAPLVAQADQGSDPSEKQLKEVQNLKVHFGFNDSDLTSEARESLANAAKFLKEQPNIRVEIQGHADERGTSEYNLALGERRAGAVRQYLEGLGVPRANIKVVSFGEERPAMSGKDEAAYAANRRSQFVTSGTLAPGAGAGNEDANKDAQAKPAEQPAQDRSMEKDPGAGECKPGGWPFKIPIWLGPLVAAFGLPGPLLGIPLIVTMIYLGPEVLTAPTSAVFPLTTKDGSPGLASGASPLNGGGSIWGIVNAQEPLAIVGAVAAAAGVGLTALASTVLFGTGAGLFIAYFLQPKGEDCDAAAAASAQPSAGEPGAEVTPVTQ